MADTPKHSVSVAGVVVDDQGRVLVIQRRDNGRWEPPGGVLELSETPQSGLKREVFEETGVHVHVERLTGVYKNVELGVVSLVFRCRPIDDGVTESDEARSVAWAALDEVHRRMLPAYAVRIVDALQADVPVRSHDGCQVLETA